MSLFKKKTELVDLINSLISRELNNHRICSHPDNKTCEVCGCIVSEKQATKGDSVVKIRESSLYQFCYYPPETITEEYIYTPYYCKVHAPKGKEKK